MDKKTTALVTIAGGLTIFGVKLGAYFISGSVALLSDALESVVNIVASCLMLFSVYISSQPADEDHHYGHEKIENISSLVEGLLILTAALFIIHTALERINDPVAITGIEGALGVSLFATALNGGLSWLLIKKARESSSMALEGDAKHLFSDVVTSLGVVVGLWVAQVTGWTLLDPGIALLVAMFIVRMGAVLVIKSARGLMDHHSPKVEEEIMALLERHNTGFVDYHDVKTRLSGNQVFAELHLSVDGTLTVQEAHDLTDHLETDLRRELPDVTITIHVEPLEGKAANAET
jgi:cation diffusion facilitator family transporter